MSAQRCAASIGTRNSRLPWCALALGMTLAGCHRQPPISDEGIAAATEPAFAPYAGPVSDLPAGGRCSLDAVDGKSAQQARVRPRSWVTFGGWMADAADAVPDGATLVLNSAAASYGVPIVAGGERPDVVQVLRKPALLRSGYNHRAWLPAIQPGSYRVFLVYGRDKAASACAMGTIAAGEP
ncbi:hypothetical protein [Xanthomonas graminis]|jgi:hypothetical protein|uniref:hypothetical protein n=1 Tax=Xanthomonas graminis TaxID=3390026 RepID=UPI000586D76A|nr:hypothetical protein [Xanthomonas translucens]OAX62287.1 hypothetical protein A6R72_00870 [Xanthomonas translucens pv. graminis]UKE53985.1 hypothetical protein KFS84_17520 [Xanthomonas translucens pv. graminis]WIH09383.1 hypothetical protein KM579_04470 [Xanthomonas translucens pv. graminis]WIH12945.1 hypothetical protein KM563_03955 [Xanthomonas translucens pv. graminis]WIH16540.1 hypothetical protein KM433_03565 [Xanthomonas translucens pv. graminis]